MAGSASEKPKDTYSPVFGFVYIFNLIIGVGALALPKAFSQAGLVLGTLLLFMLAFMSYMTATFMIEAMAIANALGVYRKRTGLSETSKLAPLVPKRTNIQSVDESGTVSGKYGSTIISPTHTPVQSETEDEKAPLVPPVLEADNVFTGSDEPDIVGLPPDDYEINKKFEMGAMANMFYHPVGVFLYYVVICLYLYGDLAIYAVAIPQSIMHIACYQEAQPNATNETFIISGNSTDMYNVSNSSDIYGNCFGSGAVSPQNTYYIFLAVTLLVLCPWTFFNLTKSKYLQLATTIMRNVAFALMVGIAISYLAQGKTASPNVASFINFPLLFGVSIYSFMCQHSLPGMVTPMRKKKGIFVLIGFDFGLILAFYFLLAYTGAFWLSARDLNDIYTLNFFKKFIPDSTSVDKFLSVLGYYLALFPVFTLSTNFPIISITLRENLKALARVSLSRWIGEKPYPWAVDRLVFPILALVIPIAIAFGTQKVELLVSITGSFPGVGVQYVIPVTLAFCGKYIVSKRLGLKYENKYKSPFSFIAFLVFVLLWTVVSVGIIVADDIIKIVKGTFLEYT